MQRLSGISSAIVLPMIFVGAVLLSVLAVWVMRVVALRLHFTDRPNPHTGNAGGAAMGGGVAVVLVFAATLLSLGSADVNASGIVLAVAGTCILGLIDDLIELAPLTKIAGQCACACLFLARSEWGFLAWIGSIMFLVLVSNAWNVVDVMDGLLGWIGTICLLGVGVVLLIHDPSRREFWSMPLIASGLLAGFLVWNRHPARVIFGDAGSLALGMLYGVFVLRGFGLDAKLGMLLLLPGLIPFFEVGFLIVQRSKKHIPFYRTSPDHFALRLEHNGHSISFINRAVIAAGAALSGTACIVAATSFNPVVVGGVAGLVVLGIIAAYRYLSRLSVAGTT